MLKLRNKKGLQEIRQSVFLNETFIWLVKISLIDAEYIHQRHIDQSSLCSSQNGLPCLV